MKDQGERTVVGRLPGGSDPAQAKFRVAGISKALTSASEMVDAGYQVAFDKENRVDVVFDKENGEDVSPAHRKPSGSRCRFARRNRAYDMDVQVFPAAEAQELHLLEPNPRTASSWTPSTSRSPSTRCA